MLEIAVCAQHNNGGLAVNCWWETNVPHLFAVGEAAGTHGIYRPGGSALNSGQTGSTRAAMFIARRYTDNPMPEADFARLAASKITPKIELARKFLENKNGHTPQEIRDILGNRMSVYAAHIRHVDGICMVKDEAAEQLQNIAEKTMLSNHADLTAAFENVDLLLAQQVYAAAMENYIISGGGSRGSYIIPDDNGIFDIPGSLKFSPDDGKLSEKIQEVHYSPQGCDFTWVDVRPIPENDDWFENVWREYRNDEIIR
jgi:succinate dehydrogenase/fumarate reductase flavoprotein subunit